MSPREHELEIVSTKQSVNDKSLEDSKSNSQAGTKELLKNSDPTTKENIPQLKPEEQAMLSEKRDSPEFQKGLQDMLPQNDELGLDSKKHQTHEEMVKELLDDKDFTKMREAKRARLLARVKKKKVSKRNPKAGMLGGRKRRGNRRNSKNVKSEKNGKRKRS